MNGEITISLHDYEQLKNSESNLIQHHEEVLKKLEAYTKDMALERISTGCKTYMYFMYQEVDEIFQGMSVKQFKRWKKDKKLIQIKDK